jgi:guanine deaminase
MGEQSYMEAAIRKAREGVEAGQSPFGAVIVKGGAIVAAAHNTVWRTTDPTAHAEVNAIRLGAAALKAIDLSGTTMYTTCEPCPMCLTAIHWAKIDRVVFGATIADADMAGFSELTIPATEMVRLGGSPLKVESGLMQKECAELFACWKSLGRGRSY